MTDRRPSVTVDTDVLVVGSEGAGARAAIEASKHGIRVTMVTKGRFGKCGATLTAGTGINIDGKSIVELLGLNGDSRDTPATFAEDTIIEGKYVNDMKQVDLLVTQGPARIKELVDWGMKVWGPVAAPGNRFVRDLRSTGPEIMNALKRAIIRLGCKITIIPDTMITDILTTDGRAAGAVGLNVRTGEFMVYRAKSVILATGGGQRIYLHTTAPEELTGDGQAMAFRAGVELIDMQFIQFLLHTLWYPPVTTRSLNPLLPLGAWLLNSSGDRFMKMWDEKRMEKSTRDFVSIGVMNEILEGRGGGDPRLGEWAYLSMKHIPDNIIDDLARRSLFYEKAFFDNLKRNAVPAFPASHFFCGGIKVGGLCETRVPGLFAAGEVAGGTHGANRIAGSAITQILVQGKIAGESAAGYALKSDLPDTDQEQLDFFRAKVFGPLERKGGAKPITLKRKIQKLSFENVGVARDGARLDKALSEIEKLRAELANVCVGNKILEYNTEWVDAIQLENMIQVLEMIVRSALMRTESRGCHFRLDYPKQSDSWVKNVILQRSAEGMKLTTQPVGVSELEMKPSGAAEIELEDQMIE